MESVSAACGLFLLLARRERHLREFVFLFARFKNLRVRLAIADAKTFAFRSFPAKCVAEFYVVHNIEFLVRRKKCGENQ